MAPNFFFNLAHPFLKFKPHDCLITSLPLSFVIWYIPFGEGWHLKCNHDLQPIFWDQSVYNVHIASPPAHPVPYLFLKNINELPVYCSYPFQEPCLRLSWYSEWCIRELKPWYLTPWTPVLADSSALPAVIMDLLIPPSLTSPVFSDLLSLCI